MTRSKERAILDAISARRMHLADFVALSVNPAPITLRFKLRRMGLDLKREEVADLLDLVDSVEAQMMLRRQTISTRYAAVERDLPKRQIWQ